MVRKRNIKPRSAAMAATPTDADEIDRLSDLPEEVVVPILSLLPTRMAARTSVLSRRFRHLWEASPYLDLDGSQITEPVLDNFVAMADRALLRRDPSHPFLSLRIYFGAIKPPASFILSLFFKASSLGLRHLAIEGSWSLDFTQILPVIFSMPTLVSLSIDGFLDDPLIPQHFGITLTSLTSLSLGLNGKYKHDFAELNEVLSQLCSLEDLRLELKCMSGSFVLSSQTIRNLQVISFVNQLHNVELSLPALESLRFESKRMLPHFNKEIPSLRKAVIRLGQVLQSDAGTVAELVNYVSHVEELSVHVYECPEVKSPIPILLEPGKVAPAFPNLKNLDATLHFHEHNIKAIVTMLANSPALESLKLIREVPKSKHWVRGRKRKDWELKLPRKRKDWGLTLPRNADVNGGYAYFRNLHLDENKKELMKLLSEMCISKNAQN